MEKFRKALIIGAGSGLSASLARKFAAEGMEVALAARDPDKLAKLCGETGAISFAVDAADPSEVEGLFEAVDVSLGAPDVVVYNASYRVRGAFETLDAAEVARTLAVTAYGAFLVAQRVVLCAAHDRDDLIAAIGRHRAADRIA